MHCIGRRLSLGSKLRVTSGRRRSQWNRCRIEAAREELSLVGWAHREEWKAFLEDMLTPREVFVFGANGCRQCDKVGGGSSPTGEGRIERPNADAVEEGGHDRVIPTPGLRPRLAKWGRHNRNQSSNRKSYGGKFLI
jgi:hypothetical protein